MRHRLLLIATALLTSSLAAHASLIGDTIHVTWDEPTVSTVGLDLSSFAVPGSGISPTLNVSYMVTGTQVILTELAGDNTNYATASFNGFVFTDTTKSTGITGITWDPSSTGGSGAVTSFTGNSFALNFEGLSLNAGQKAIFDLNFAPTTVPEPSSLLLLGSGLLGLAGAARRRLLA